MELGHDRRLIAIGDAGAITLLLVAAASALSAAAPAPVSTAAPSPIAQASTDAAAPTLGYTPSPADTTAPSSAEPSPALPRAGSFPIIRSCIPATVPSAVEVTTPPVAKTGSFVMKVPVLMYHRIVPLAEAGNSIRGLVVPPETFSAQLDALEGAGWKTIRMAELASHLQAHVKVPPRTFVITIDDGWDDGYAYALPTLAKHGFVATYFVIAGRIDTPDFLSSRHLRDLIAAGDEIGDHTMDHAILTRAPASHLQYEIDAAAARIAQATGRWPESFAYPHGAFDSAAEAGVAACGELRTAVIEQVSLPAPPGASPAPLPNPTVRPTGLPNASAAPGIATAAAASASAGPVPFVQETWTDRWAIPRIRVGPGTSGADLLKELAPEA